MTQLDLFGVVLTAEQQQEAAERQRLCDALLCLRDAVPSALGAVAYLRYQARADTRAPHASGRWAYCVCRAGLRFEASDAWWNDARERGETWGWSRTPAHLVTWTELAALISDDPRRADVAAWADSLPEPRWRCLMRPHELWPDPDGWHTSYFCGDHVDAHWTGRRRAWQLVQDLLTDAITALSGQGNHQHSAPLSH